MIRKDHDGTLKYTLCNPRDKETSIEERAYFQCKRYFVERSFQDAKQSLGMNQYECRSENAWNKHMKLCM